MKNVDIEKAKLKNLSASELVLDENFKNLTIQDIMRMFNCRLKIRDGGFNSSVELRIICRSNKDKQFGSLQGVHLPPIGNAREDDVSIAYLGENPVKLVTTNPAPNTTLDLSVENTTVNTDEKDNDNGNKSENENSSDNINIISDSSEMPNYKVMKIHDRDALGLTENKVDDQAVYIKLKPFNELSIDELYAIVTNYYQDRISLDDIMSSWKIGSSLTISYDINCLKDGTIVLPNRQHNTCTLTITAFDSEPLSSPFLEHERALMSLSCTDRSLCTRFEYEIAKGAISLKWNEAISISPFSLLQLIKRPKNGNTNNVYI